MAARSSFDDLHLPRSVRLELEAVVERLSRSRPLAIWLSGSAVRGQLRRQSDIDWVVVSMDGVAKLPRGWPSERHSFQWYSKDRFLSGLQRGHEFAVWQIAYGWAACLDKGFRNELEKTHVAGVSVAVKNKMRVIRRRVRRMRLFLECGDLEAVRFEYKGLVHQRLRLELLKAGVVPGSRAEVGDQLSLVAPSQLDRTRKRGGAPPRSLAAAQALVNSLEGVRMV